MAKPLPYKRTFQVRWADLDFNGHMKNTAYLDYAADVRMMFFDSQGISMETFVEVGFGPVVFKDEITYYRERRLLEPFDVCIEICRLSEDNRRFCLRNHFTCFHGPMATVVSHGGWMNLQERRIMTPPRKLIAAIKAIPKGEDFEVG